MAAARDRLLADEDAFASILAELDLHLDGAAVAYIAHWITPVVEPRRYDTRFFVVEVTRDEASLVLRLRVRDKGTGTEAAAEVRP